jgi:hypothetical protein
VLGDVDDQARNAAYELGGTLAALIENLEGDAS